MAAKKTTTKSKVEPKPKPKAAPKPTAEPKAPKTALWLCVACDDVTKTYTPACRDCGTVCGYQPAPKGTKFKHKRKRVDDEGDGFDPMGKKDDEDDEDDYDPDDFPEVTAIGEVEIEDRSRISTGVPFFDKILGGSAASGWGIVTGSSILIDGMPGAGKSTLLLQTLANIALKGKVLYFTAEEKSADIAARAQRLGLLKSKKIRDNLLIVQTSNTDAMIDIVDEEEPIAVAVDSIQMFYSKNANGNAGTEPQCKYIHHEFVVATCGEMGISTFIISQVRKDGDMRGPQTISHMVDAHIKFESIDPDSKAEMRRKMSNVKNRNIEDGSFETFAKMTKKGLITTRPVNDDEIGSGASEEMPFEKASAGIEGAGIDGFTLEGGEAPVAILRCDDLLKSPKKRATKTKSPPKPARRKVA